LWTSWLRCDAAKTVDPLYVEFDVRGIGDVALGLVALSGKVVEHDEGYRAAEATVVALGASMGDYLMLTSDPNQIDEIFDNPTVISQASRVEAEDQRFLEMESFVTDEARRAEQWI
jgi:hypothetical protein